MAALYCIPSNKETCLIWVYKFFNIIFLIVKIFN